MPFRNFCVLLQQLNAISAMGFVKLALLAHMRGVYHESGASRSALEYRIQKSQYGKGQTMLAFFIGWVVVSQYSKFSLTREVPNYFLGRQNRAVLPSSPLTFMP